PPVPCDIGESNQLASEIQSPAASVVSVVPPTPVIAGTEPTAFSPWSVSPGGADQSPLNALHSSPAVSPLDTNADVPRDSATCTANSTGARSAALTIRSQPMPSEVLHTAPGNCRSA